MFIEITTPTNPLRIENILRPYKQGEQPFTPEVAQQILSSTNYPRSIRDMLTLIANLPASEQARYKDLILATFDHREQPNDVTIIGKKLALANNYEDELNQIINHDPTTDEKEGIIYAPSINEAAAYICASRRPNLSKYPPNITLYCISHKVNLRNTNFAKVKNLKFKEDSKVDLSHCTNLPEDLDISMCSYVDFFASDLSLVKNLKFKEGSAVNLYYCTNLPEDLDVSLCSEVNLSHADLSNIKSLKFKKGSTIYINDCKSLPENLDISKCHKINLFQSNLASVKTLTLKNKTQQKESWLEIPEDWQGKIIYIEKNIFTSLNSLFKKSNTH